MQPADQSPLIASMTIKKIFRWILFLFLFFITLIVLAASIIRFVVFPNIDQYKSDIANFASETIQRKVTIGGIQTGWHHLSPRVILTDINIYDEQKRPALLLKQIDTELSWLSIGLLDLRLSELTAHEPQLIIRRSKDNIFYVAGINMSGRGNPDFANWLLAQSKVGIKNANITYIDELRQAPKLSLNKLDFTLTNSAWRSLLGRHQFAINAFPSIGTHHPIQVNGYFIGKDISNMHQWHGEINAKLENTNLATWSPWLDFPINIKSGQGNANAKLAFAKNKIEKVEANINLKNVAISTQKQSTLMTAEYANGIVGWSNLKDTQSIHAKQLNLKLNTGLEMKNATGSFSKSEKNQKPWITSDVAIDELHLEALQKTVEYFNLPQKWSEYMIGLSPKGQIKTLKASLSGDPASLSKYSFKANFNDLSINSFNKIPGFNNLTGSINTDEDTGKLTLNSTNATLDFKDILRWPIPDNKITGLVNWDTSNHDHIVISTNELFISNPHITGTVKAKYDLNQKQSDFMDLSGNFDKGDAKFALFYYPISLGPDTLHWLDTSIVEGQVSDVNLIIKGSPSNFPFVTEKGVLDPKLGIFRVTSTIKNAKIDYGEGWPAIQDLTANMLFEGTRMEVNATKGRILGTKIIKSKAEIPQLDADWPVLKCVSEAEGSISEGLNFVNNSPVKQVTMGFTDDLRTAGNAHLNLELLIPLQDSESSVYKGAYQISNGTMYANPDIGIPELSNINGTLNFNQNGINANKVTANVMGGPAQFNLTSSSNKTIQINAKGQASDLGIKNFLAQPMLSAIHGTANWDGEIIITKPLANITIKSNLVGMAIDMPAPFNKLAEESKSLTIEKKQTIANADSLHVKYDGLLNANLLRIEKEGKLNIDRGEISINSTPKSSNTSGVHISAKLEALNGDEWLAFLNKTHDNASTQSSTNNAAFNIADIEINQFNIFNRTIQNLKIAAKPTQSGFKMNIQSKEISGDAEWLNDNNGKIIAKLKKLIIPQNPDTTQAEKNEIRKQSKQYPALDITAENFEIGNKKLGTLELNAFEDGESWIIQKLNLHSPDTTLKAEGTWHNWTRSPNTFLKFDLQSTDVGKTLIAFGQPGIIKNGNASVTGVLQWPGSPHEFDTSGLNGSFNLEAEKGQILKAQPGVGRLLGLLSLQSLPRRLTLDFRDLFSDGFAFDKITATATANNGVLKSNDFFMTGPAAEAKIKGETNLKTETQNLTVKVRPHVSDTLSLAALAGGPIVGAAAFVAQKLLKDPLNKIASTEYVITGTWSDPQEVESNKGTKELPQSSPIDR
jgi:uncharacterized protein (TIGR02099 family)